MSESLIPDEEHTGRLPTFTQEELAKIKELAEGIKSNAHLKTIVRAADPDLREQVYLIIVRYVTFKPVPFDKKWAFN